MTDSDSAAKPALTVAQYAEANQVCSATVYRLIAAGKLPSLRLGRAIRIPVDAAPVVGAR
jgi:excisionase family DNA binding protein